MLFAIPRDFSRPFVFTLPGARPDLLHPALWCGAGRRFSILPAVLKSIHLIGFNPNRNRGILKRRIRISYMPMIPINDATNRNTNLGRMPICQS